MPSHVCEIDLSDGPGDRPVQASHAQSLVLVRFRGRPLGSVRMSCVGGLIRWADFMAAIEGDRNIGWTLTQATLSGLLLATSPLPPQRSLSWSIIICTRDRSLDLRRCLESVMKLDLSGGEVIVVDNAPSDESTAGVAAEFAVRYVRENRPGLNWARARGARAASGEVVIYTDDDVVVDRGWVDAILEPFEHPRVACVTGLAMPLELETEAQELFEQYGGFSRGFRRRVIDFMVIPPAAAGRCGAGVNMALRRKLVNGMRLFDAELDCGTAALTGGDNYAFYQLLVEGWQIVYNPEALVWHRHRRDRQSLRQTISGYTVGGLAFLMRCLFVHGDWQAITVGLSWLRHDHVHRLKESLLGRTWALPLDITWGQFAAIFRAPFAYWRSRRAERAAARAGPIDSPATAAGGSCEHARL